MKAPLRVRKQTSCASVTACSHVYSLNRDLLHLVESYFIGRAIIKLRRTRAFVRGQRKARVT
jgi:hypothetical protein